MLCVFDRCWFVGSISDANGTAFRRSDVARRCVADTRYHLVGKRRDGRGRLGRLQLAEHMALVVVRRTGPTGDKGEQRSGKAGVSGRVYGKINSREKYV